MYRVNVMYRVNISVEFSTHPFFGALLQAGKCQKISKHILPENPMFEDVFCFSNKCRTNMSIKYAWQSLFSTLLKGLTFSGSHEKNTKLKISKVRREYLRFPGSQPPF